MEHAPFDLAAYEHHVTTGPCFICMFLAGKPGYEHEVAYEDDDHVAFLDRHPTLIGRVLVTPRRHVEHIVRDLDESSFLKIMTTVRRVARAVETVLHPERTYLLSLGSQEGTAHLHWHIVPVPHGIPFENRFDVLQFKYRGTVALSTDEMAHLAEQIRRAIAASGSVN